jgi:hypothetical protein
VSYEVKSGDVIQAALEATKPVIIAHVVNNVRAWGAGFVLALSKQWSLPEAVFINMEPSRGASVLVPVQKNVNDVQLYVANMYAQMGLRQWNNPQPLRYDLLFSALSVTTDYARALNADIYVPYLIGCGLGGGDVYKVTEMLEEFSQTQDISAYKL